jgi:hypothetical protein
LDLTQPVPTVQVQQRVSLTGEVIEVPVAVPAHAGPPPLPGHAPHGVPATGARPPSVRSPTAVVSGLPTGAVSPQLMREAHRPEVSLAERWEKFLALALPLLVGMVWLIHLQPGAIVWALLAGLFGVGLFMGATGAISSYDDAFLDCTIVLLLCYFVGPVFGLAAYLVVGLVKQEVNGSMVALLIGHLATRMLGHWAAESVELSVGEAIAVGFANFLGFFYICATFAGWMLSSFFRPINE